MKCHAMKCRKNMVRMASRAPLPSTHGVRLIGPAIEQNGMPPTPLSAAPPTHPALAPGLCRPYLPCPTPAPAPLTHKK